LKIAWALEQGEQREQLLPPTFGTGEQAIALAPPKV